jgi:hypothetical protein
MDDLNGGVHTSDRLLVGVFTFDYVEVLDLATLNLGEFEVDFIEDPIDADNRRLSSLAVNSDGMMSIGFFGNGFRSIANGAASYMSQAATAASAAINVVDATHGDNQTSAPWAAAIVRDVAVNNGGTNAIEYALDGDTIVYTSGGFYFPLGSQIVKQYNVTTGVQGANFATIPIGPGANTDVKGLFPLADGGWVVCNSQEIVRLNAAGTVVMTYTPVLTNRVWWIVDAEIDADGQFLWALDGQSMALFKFDLALGTQVLAMPTHLVSGTATSLVVYRASSSTPQVIPINTAHWKLHRFDLKPRREERA